MKVGIVTPYSWSHPGGVNEHVKSLYRKLREFGHTAKIIAPASGKTPPEPGLQVKPEDLLLVGRTFPIRANASTANIAFGPGIARRLGRILAEEDFDVLHLHEPLIPSVSMIALLKSNCANVATFHAAREAGSTGYRLARPLLARILRRVDARIAVSASACELASRYFPGDYAIVPNGVDTAIYSPQVDSRPELGGGEHVLFVGRFEPRKGLPVLLKAWPAILAQRPEAKLVIVGAGSGADPFASLQEKELASVVRCGRVPEGDMPSYYRSASLLVSPAMGMESFGIILVEAMATGIPVVASDIPGYRAVVGQSGAGVLFPPGEHAVLAEVVAGLLEDKERRAAMGRAARARAACFSWDTVARQVEDVYESALEAAAKRGAHGR